MSEASAATAAATAEVSGGAVRAGFRLLHVEDDGELASVVGAALRAAGFEVDLAEDAGKAISLAEKRNYDLALVDVRLPGAMDGLVFSRWLRARWPLTGIVMHTVVGGVESRCGALEDVCDDYIVKPCQIEELVARLRAVARRSSRPLAPPVLAWGPFRVDLLRDRVWVEEREVNKLQPLQVRFLGYLVLNAGRVCTHDELREGVFGAEAIGDRNCARIISVLRKRCGNAGKRISTVKGTGYGLGID